MSMNELLVATLEIAMAKSNEYQATEDSASDFKEED